MSWASVHRWREHLRGLTPSVPHLSTENARFCLDSALDAWDSVPGLLDRRAPEHTVIVCASTVFTGPLEWCAVLLARGGRVTLKAPRGLGAWFAQLPMPGLALEVSADRSSVFDADRVVAMGSDATISSIRSVLPNPSVLLGFGHRFSVAWWKDPDHAEDLALDLAMYDGRGCMSPVSVYSPLPDAGPRLADAMRRVARVLPLGTISGLEAARARERRARATVLGRVHDSVCELPLAGPSPGLCRTPVLHRCDRSAFLQAIAPHLDHLSSIGTDENLPVSTRQCALGQMQRPPLDRLHDGVDWVRAV